MIKEPYFEWNEESGQSVCILDDKKDKLFIGTATCHDDDRDMMSQKTGERISYFRAKIEYLKNVRDNLKIQLQALNQLYYSMNTSKKFNAESYENKMLQRQIRIKSSDLETIKEIIAQEQEELRNFIFNKDCAYKAIRRERERKNN